jgi:hypothetical protein
VHYVLSSAAVVPPKLSARGAAEARQPAPARSLVEVPRGGEELLFAQDYAVKEKATQMMSDRIDASSETGDLTRRAIPTAELQLHMLGEGSAGETSPALPPSSLKAPQRPASCSAYSTPVVQVTAQR